MNAGSSGNDDAGQRARAERATRRGARWSPASGRRRGRAPSRGRAGGGPAAPAGRAAGGCSRAGRRRRPRSAPASSTCCRPTTPPADRAARACTTAAGRSRPGRCGCAPVCSLAPAGAGELGDPPLDRGVDVLVGCRRTRTSPRSISSATRRARRAIGVASASAMISPTCARPATWATDPAMSSGHSRRSNDRLTVNAISSAPGRPRTDRARASSSPASPSPVELVCAVIVRPASSRRRAASAGPPSAPRRRTATCRRRPPCRSARRMPERSRAEATTWAQPGGVRSTTRLPDTVTSATHSPITRRSWSSGAMRAGSYSGIAYTVSPPGTRTLTAPRSSRSRDTVACVAAMPSSASSSTSCGWLVDRVLADQLGDHLLALHLAWPSATRLIARRNASSAAGGVQCGCGPAGTRGSAARRSPRPSPPRRGTPAGSG